MAGSQKKTLPIFQSTLPARGATRRDYHAGNAGKHFNPRSPHGERRPRLLSSRISKIFQSTLPARGATLKVLMEANMNTYFNPRSPHGERLEYCQNDVIGLLISIHAPRTGSDGERSARTTADQISIHAPRTGSDDSAGRVPIFSSISIHAPRTGSDLVLALLSDGFCISIHAPRTGSDGKVRTKNICRRNFNPRSPHGERQKVSTTISLWKSFQSTLPARGATCRRTISC